MSGVGELVCQCNRVTDGKKKVIIVIMIIMMTPTSEKNNELCGAHDDINITMLVTLKKNELCDKDIIMTMTYVS